VVAAQQLLEISKQGILQSHSWLWGQADIVPGRPALDLVTDPVQKLGSVALPDLLPDLPQRQSLACLPLVDGPDLVEKLVQA